MQAAPLGFRHRQRFDCQGVKAGEGPARQWPLVTGNLLQQDPQQAAAALQSEGVASAPIVHAETLFDVEHFERADFFIDLERAFSGPQRQAGLSIVRDGKRLGARRPAPLLGEHSWEVLGSRASVSIERYQQLLREGVISFEPAPSRNIVAPQAMIGAN